ncbi:MAG TPA: UDP-glucose--hexose-1-phosphate uridylyltransferase [Bacilli bacterium]|nr:UDP-glucose--hexose-1-phosphate uridylyltransferase [Bacilli bacterium]
MNINYEINRLIEYGIETLLIDQEDRYYVANQIIDILRISEFTKETVVGPLVLNEILGLILDYAYEQGIIEVNDDSMRDLLDAKIMNCFVSKPYEVIKQFYMDYKIDPTLATDNLYRFCKHINYIRMDRISKNKHWTSKTPYGDIEISINLSKPEKDPKTIALAKLSKSTQYPKCLLCVENVGFAGGLNHPARQNHRIIPITLNNEKFYFQFSPYIYYNEHAIVLMEQHVDMNITTDTFKRLLDFVDMFPGYFLGSNAGLPIVGGSILNHEHYQGGKYHFPIEDAKPLQRYQHSIDRQAKIEMLNWPTSTIRIASTSKNNVTKISNIVYETWENYSDLEANLVSHTGKTLHNAITPICRKKEDWYEMDIVLRNNRTTDEFPHGIFHPHPETHHIKKENIGLIEVMGLAILPGRLQTELQEIKDALLLSEVKLSSSSVHKEWYQELRKKYNHNTDIDLFLQDEVANKFLQAITDAGVFKQTTRGLEYFDRFMKKCGFQKR